MAFKNKRWAMAKCWVPNCANGRINGYTKNLFHLPLDPKYRELWIAMAGKKVTGTQEEIYFCQDHFLPDDIDRVVNQALYLKRNAIPYDKMPQKICRTCMSLIGLKESFSVLSKTIPCAVPVDMKLSLSQCRPEPLYQILTFCIPDLNLQPDPPPLICCKCFQNIWVYFTYKVTCNVVEKGLRGNLTPEEYGKMVLCRTCPETSGTNYFILSEETLMGTMLKKMFLNEYPADVVPLKVCLRCWNTLYKLKNFYEQCMAVEQKMQRHILLNQSGLGDISQYSANVPTNLDTPQASMAAEQKMTVNQKLQRHILLDQSELSDIGQYFANVPIDLDAPRATVSRLREVRKNSQSSSNINSSKVYPKAVNQNCVTESITKSQITSNVENPVLSSTSVIKFAGDTEQRPQMKESNILEAEIANRPDLQQQEQHDSYKRAYTWVPPPLNANPVVIQKTANTWTPPIVNTQNTQSVSIQEKPNTRASSVANCQSNTKPWMPSIVITQSISIQKESDTRTSSVANENSNTEKDQRPQNGPQFPSSSKEAWNNALRKRISEKKIRKEQKLLKTSPDFDTRSAKKAKYAFLFKERIALASLMLKYGKPLKYKSSPETQFDAWIKIVKEFHKFNNERSLEYIQSVWYRMKRKAESVFTVVGPADQDDQLVIDYLYYCTPDTDTATSIESAVGVIEEEEEDDVICIDDEMPEVEEIVTDREKTDEANSESCELSTKIPVTDNDPQTSKILKRKRGRPAKTLAESAPVVKKKYVESLKNNRPSSTKLTKKKAGRKRAIVRMKEWGYKQNLDLAWAIRKEYDNCLKNNELIPGKSPWKMLIERLRQGSYSNYPFDKLYYIWTKIKRSATIYEKNGQDLVDEEVWELLQMQNAIQRSLAKNSTSTKGAKEVSTMENKPETSSGDSEMKNRISSMPFKESDHSRPLKSNNDTSSTLDAKLNTKTTTDDKRTPQCWTEDEKIEFFKLIKQEFNSMAKNKEPLARPWHTIVQRIAERGYKNCNQQMLYSLWSAIRRNATLHENDRQLTMLDCKVLRLLRLAKKLKDLGETGKTPKNKNDQKVPDVTDISETIVDETAEATVHTETGLGQNEHKEMSRTVEDEDCQEIAVVEGTPDDDEGGNNGKHLSLQEKLDFVEVIKCYDNEIFKNDNLKQKNFWRSVVADHKAKGYNRDRAQLISYWERMHKSAKLAWAQQKETSPCDKVIIDFMMEMIEKKKEEGGRFGENQDSSDEEISDIMSNASNQPEIEERSSPVSSTVNFEDDRRSANSEAIDFEETDNVNLNYDYVSLEDLETDFGGDGVESKPGLAELKIESYVSIEDCAIDPVDPTMQSEGEVIVIDDSDEE